MSKLAENLIKIVAITLTTAMCLLLASIGVMQARMGIADVKDALQWRDKTSPLDQSVVKDICLKFVLPPDDPRCKSGARVYAPDFFDVIRDTFQPKTGPWATYDQVQQRLGKYQYRYEPPVTTGDGLTYFAVGYDLRGDRVYPVGMFFYADGRLWRLVAGVGD